MDSVQFFCSDCNVELKSEIKPCFSCGSVKKTVRITVEDEMKLYDQIKLKAKGKIGERKIVHEQTDGYESSFNGDIVNKVRIIDNVNDIYFEEVKDLDGNIIHKCQEKLSEHKGHGSAKNKKNNE